MKHLAPLLILSLLLVISSCSSTKSDNITSILPATLKVDTYAFEDQSGAFLLQTDRRYVKKNNEFVVKRKLYAVGDPSKKTLEKSISISNFGVYKGIKILRPYLSQYHIWFDGKKYSSELKINIKKKSLDIKLRSPEEKWNGNKTVPFPKGPGAFCFYSQLSECAKVTGFLEKAIDRKSGDFNFHIIWDGYPYIMDQYANIPPSVFAPARMSYGGMVKKTHYRFSLEVGGQVQFLIFNKKLELSKVLWVSQGISIIKQ